MTDRDAVVKAYRDGVLAVRVVSGWFRTRDWDKPTPCAEWPAVDVAGHLVCVARWYHEWLDRAEVGRPQQPLLREELAPRNAEALAALEIAGGPERVSVFARTAESYLARVVDAWHLPYGFPSGTTTAGVHAAVAAGEWHVHAWDLAVAVGRRHRAADADVMVEARRVAGLKVPDRPDAWEALLRSTGRDPHRWP